MALWGTKGKKSNQTKKNTNKKKKSEGQLDRDRNEDKSDKSAYVRECAQGVAVPGIQTCQTDGTSMGRNLEEGRKRNRDPKSKRAKCNWIT